MLHGVRRSFGGKACAEVHQDHSHLVLGFGRLALVFDERYIIDPDVERLPADKLKLDAADRMRIECSGRAIAILLDRSPQHLVLGPRRARHEGFSKTVATATEARSTISNIRGGLGEDGEPALA